MKGTNMFFAKRIINQNSFYFKLIHLEHICPNATIPQLLQSEIDPTSIIFFIRSSVCYEEISSSSSFCRAVLRAYPSLSSVNLAAKVEFYAVILAAVLSADWPKGMVFDWQISDCLTLTRVLGLTQYNKLYERCICNTFEHNCAIL